MIAATTGVPAEAHIGRGDTKVLKEKECSQNPKPSGLIRRSLRFFCFVPDLLRAAIDAYYLHAFFPEQRLRSADLQHLSITSLKNRSKYMTAANIHEAAFRCHLYFR